MTKPKILFVITQGTWGGAQRYVFDIATNICEKFDVTVAVGEPNGAIDLQKKLAANCQKTNIVIVQLNHVVRPISPYHDLLAIWELAELYRKIKPNIIHLNSSKAGILGSIAKLLVADPALSVIYTVHGWVFLEPLPQATRRLYRWLEKNTASLKQKIIVLSQADFVVGARLGIAANKMAVIPLALATQKFLDTKTARETLIKTTGVALPNKGLLFGTIANLFATKGLDVLIRAWARIGKDISATLTIIGEGPERKKLEHLINNLHLQQKIYLAGSIENAARLLPAFDAFVLPSVKEGLPYTMLEALAARLPIIATKVGGIPELISERKNCRLVTAGSVPELSSALIATAQDLVRGIQTVETSPTPPLEKMLSAIITIYRDGEWT